MDKTAASIKTKTNGGIVISPIFCCPF